MFESNFPVDMGSCSYATLWNAFKHIAKGASAAEKTALFSGTAQKVYRLESWDLGLVGAPLGRRGDVGAEGLQHLRRGASA